MNPLKPIIQKTFYITIKVIIVLFILILFYLLSTIILSVIPANAKKDQSKEMDIYIMTNGVHTDFVLPVQNSLIDWRSVFIPEEGKVIPPSYRHIAIGWGNRDFYLNTPTWADLKVSTALSAGLGLGESLYHIIWLRNIYEDEDVRRLTISYEQYQRLINYILNDIKTDEEGKPVQIISTIAYGPNDYFYEAKGHYSIFFSCNTWVNSGLKAMGQKAALWTPFQQGIFYHYREHPTPNR